MRKRVWQTSVRMMFGDLDVPDEYVDDLEVSLVLLEADHLDEYVDDLEVSLVLLEADRLNECVDGTESHNQDTLVTSLSDAVAASEKWKGKLTQI